MLLNLLGAALITFAIAPSSCAQTESFESLVEIPASTWPLAEPLRRDASAIDELTANRTAMGVGKWGSLKADGVAILGKAQTTSEAHLLLSGERAARLDVSDSSGVSITMVDDKGGFMHTAAGSLRLDPQPSAINSVPLQLLLASVEFKALLDRGVLAVDGIVLHRVTALLGSRPGSHGQDHPIDFYFDPATHLLRMSVVGLSLPGSGSELVQITRYEGYRSDESIVFPHLIKQYLGGQPIWVIAISSVKLGQKLDSSSFSIGSGS